ncbi:MAG: ribonuclease HII [Arenimonas sp.]
MSNNIRLVAGVDEAGRGPLAGPVVCAAVILDRAKPIAGLGDSKALSAKKREQLFPLIQEFSLAWKIIFIEAADIDRLNIFKATMEGMRRAVSDLNIKPQHALIDGNKIPPGLPCSAEALVKGDARETCIMAASILAKVARDAYMLKLHEQFPQYDFAQHKGYPTAAHFAALKLNGPCPEHRRSFAPVRELIDVSLF